MRDSRWPFARGSIPCRCPFNPEDAQGKFRFQPWNLQGKLLGKQKIIVTGPSKSLRKLNGKTCFLRQMLESNTVLGEILQNKATMQRLQRWLSSDRSMVALITGVIVECRVRDTHTSVSQIITESELSVPLTSQCGHKAGQYTSSQPQYHGDIQEAHSYNGIPTQAYHVYASYDQKPFPNFVFQMEYFTQSAVIRWAFAEGFSKSFPHSSFFARCVSANIAL